MAQPTKLDGGASVLRPVFGQSAAGWETRAPAKAKANRLRGPYLLMLAFVFVYLAWPYVMQRYFFLLFLRPNQTLLLLAGAWLVLEKTMSGDPVVLSPPESHALIFFLGPCAISAATSYWPGATVDSTIVVAKAVGVYLIMINTVTTRKRLRGLYWALTLGAAVAATGTIQNYLQGMVNNEGRAVYWGTFANSNDVAMALVVVIPLTLVLAGGASWAGRILLAGCIGLSMYGIFVTFSRTGLVGLAAAGAVMAVRANPGTRNAVVAAALVAGLLFPVYSVYWDRDTGFSNLEADTNFQYRILSIEAGLDMFRSSPFLGIGLGVSFIGYSSAVHNTYIQVLAETGLLGTTFFLAAIIFSLIGVSRVQRRSRRRGDLEMRSLASGAESSFLGYLICASASPLLLSWMLFFLVGVCSSIRKVARAEAPPPVPSEAANAMA